MKSSRLNKSLLASLSIALSFAADLASAGEPLKGVPLGNGDGAGGGPPVSAYYRVDPDFRCPAGSKGPEAPGYSGALLSDDSYGGIAAHVNNYYDPCTDQVAPLSEEEANSIQQSPVYAITSQFRLFRGELYEMMSSFEFPLMRSYVFGWCKSRRGTGSLQDYFGTDVMLYRDPVTDGVQATIYISVPVGDGHHYPYRDVTLVWPFHVTANGNGYTRESFRLEFTGTLQKTASFFANIDGEAHYDLLSCEFNE